MREIVTKLPHYDYIYLGDNARAPYGPRSFETVYRYTLQCVKWFFDQGCSLVILACNTASAKALRTIQQKDLPVIAPDNRVLGVIRPTAEIIGTFSETGSVGILATNGTVASESYPMEAAKFFPELKVYQEACPMWVPLVENEEYDQHGADFFVKKNLHNIFEKGENIDVILLACTHYPLLKEGDSGDFMLLILTGSAEVRVQIPGIGNEKIAELRPGSTVGETSMIDGMPRFITCIATAPTDFAVLTRDSFNSILMQAPRLGNKLLLTLLHLLSARLREAYNPALTVTL